MKVFMYSKGFVRVKLWGSGVERFLVLCARNQMYLWEIQAQNKYIYANIRLKDFYQCRKLARKAGVRAVVVERHGLPFFIPKIFNRSFFLVGIALFVVCWLVSTNMLLHIKLNGNYSITDDVFMDFLKEQNIHLGMWIKDIPLEDLEKQIRKKFDLITWTSGKLDGTVLIIDMKENEKPVSTVINNNHEYGSSIYATVDGIVQSVYVRNGVPMVKKGAEIKKGDLLVDGRVPVYNAEQTIAYYQYYEADADIFIETTLPVSLVLERVYIEKQYTGRTKNGNYVLIGNKIYRNTFAERKFYKMDLFFTPKHTIHVGNYSFGSGKFQTREYMEVERAYTKEEAETLLQDKFQKNNALLVEKGVQILDKNVTIDLIMGKWTLKGEMRVIMPGYTIKPNEIPEELDDSESI